MKILHHFVVAGSPISVNRYGTHPYKAWRQRVYAVSVQGHRTGIKITTPTSVVVRYFRHLDRRKDVDNILKAILDALDGRNGSKGKKDLRRILSDDREVERITSQRTDLNFHNVLYGTALTPMEFAAILRAQYNQAAIYVRVQDPPDHSKAV